MTPTGNRAGQNGSSAAEGNRQDLSPAQIRMWLLERLQPAMPAAQLMVQLRIRGLVEPQRWQAAVDALVRRHPALGTGIVQSQTGEPIRDPVRRTARLLVTDLRAKVPAGQVYDEARAVAKRHSAVAFDLAVDSPLRVHLVRMADDEWLLILTVHRVAADEASLAVIVADLGSLYAKTADALARRLRTDGWEALEEAERRRRLEFWVSRLKGSLPFDLPMSHARPATASGKAGRVVRQLAPAVAKQIRVFSDSDTIVVVVAALTAVVSRYSGQTDVVLGVDPIAWPHSVGSVGCGPDPVPLRVELADSPTFAELVRRCRVGWAEATANQAPVLELVRHHGAWRTRDRHPLFQVSVAAPIASPGSGWPTELAVSLVTSEPLAQTEDLRLEVFDGPDGLAVAASYATDLFEEPVVARLLSHLETLLVAALENPNQTLLQLPLATEEERHALLSDWQGPTIPYAVEPVHEQIRRRAQQHPNLVAVRLGDDELTYAQLVQRAQTLAHYLRAKGVQPEEIVAVAIERGLDVYVALVGVLFAGCAFVMIDPHHPENRITYLLDDTAARIVLTRSALSALLPRRPGIHKVCLDGDWSQIEAAAAPEPPAEWAHHDSLAYVLYTSGSTGKPKGVLIEHGPLSNFLLWLSWLFDLGPGDRMLQHMSLAFDFAHGEIFTALTAGATMVLVPEESRTDPKVIGELLCAERISYLGGPPAILSRLPNHDYPDLKYMVVGGEAFTADLVNRLGTPGRRFINGYGPTEAAVGCIYYECEHRVWQSPPPIGRPMPNRYAYVVDTGNQLAPVGVPGEILVGGAGLARGYLNSPELTQHRFITDPFRPPARAYRTGDVGMWTESGQIQFLGRIDSQVKVNGLRVELEEIESVLTSHPAVMQAAVVVKNDRQGAARLVGYVVANGTPSNDELRRHLHEELPAYMVPGTFVALDALPLTPVGKVDRNVLKAIDDGHDEQAAFTAPQTAMQQRVAHAYATVLGIGRIGIDDDFYSLGGDSLRGLCLLSSLSQSLGVTMPLADFDRTPTVAAVARFVERAALHQTTAHGEKASVKLPDNEGPAAPLITGGLSPARRAALAQLRRVQGEDAPASRAPGGETIRVGAVTTVTVRPEGVREAFLCPPPVSGSAYWSLPLSRMLPLGHPIVAFEAPGLTSGTALTSVPEMARAFLDAAAADGYAGPYLLAGYSMGATVAYEMARQLQADGRPAAALIMIDPDSPAPRPPSDDHQQLFQFVQDIARSVDRLVPQLPASLHFSEETMAEVHELLQSAGLVPAGIDADFIGRRYQAFRAHMTALERYDAPAYERPACIVSTAESGDYAAQWRARIGGTVKHLVVPGDHYTMWSAQNRPALAAALAELAVAKDF